MISAVLGLAQFVPGLARLFGSDKAADAADQVLGIARNITGIDDPGDAVAKINADLELQVRLKEITAPIVVAELEAEAKKLESINATIRAEAQSQDKFVSRWRPFFGYIVAITWGLQMLAISIVVVRSPADASTVITAMSSLSMIWGIALSVLGISVHKRSQDKLAASGQAPSAGITAALINRISGTKK